jgi:hypothetical protein
VKIQIKGLRRLVGWLPLQAWLYMWMCPCQPKYKGNVYGNWDDCLADALDHVKTHKPKTLMDEVMDEIAGVLAGQQESVVKPYSQPKHRCDCGVCSPACLISPPSKPYIGGTA